MEKIKEIRFEGDKIVMVSSEGRKYYRNLADFSRLEEATEEQRNSYKINSFGDGVRWEDIDEDIHITSFYETSDHHNEVALIFYNFPMIDVDATAQYMGLRPKSLYDYIYGLKKASPKRLQEIKKALNQIGARMCML
ncbi:MAG: DUF2442 domain-containing protein [Bacteroidales bacterium]|nr:DUF2442 domain-containing protein [Bacteroidales bacterium]